MPTNEAQRAWNGDHVANPATYRYGCVDPACRIAKIESSVELTEAEQKLIEQRISDFGARYAIVRPAFNHPESLDVEFRAARPFERIRRITGYLTGSLETWNSAKQAEERDRVKHGLPHPEEEINTHIKED